MTTALEKEFHSAMLGLYAEAKSALSYNASRFLSMLADRTGTEVAHDLIYGATPSDGYTFLWQSARLDLSVEALVQDERWWPLFTDADRARAAHRLRDYAYTGYFAPKQVSERQE